MQVVGESNHKSCTWLDGLTLGSFLSDLLSEPDPRWAKSGGCCLLEYMSTFSPFCGVKLGNLLRIGLRKRLRLGHGDLFPLRVLGFNICKLWVNPTNPAFLSEYKGPFDIVPMPRMKCIQNTPNLKNGLRRELVWQHSFRICSKGTQLADHVWQCY